MRRTVAINETYCRGDILVPIGLIEGGFRTVRCPHYDPREVRLGSPTMEILAMQVVGYEIEGWITKGEITGGLTTHMEQFLFFFEREVMVDEQYSQTMVRACMSTYCPYE